TGEDLRQHTGGTRLITPRCPNALLGRNRESAMKIKPVGKLIILILVAAIAYAGWKWWSGRHTPGGVGGGIVSEGGPQGLLGRPLIVGIVYWPGYAGGIFANNGFEPNKDCIYWKKYNLQVKFVNIDDPDQANKAFAKGGPDGVDIVWSTVD